MPAASNVQSSFLGGEWSPMAQGQHEHKRYGTAMARCLNTIPTEEASAVRRPGFRQLGTTRDGGYARLLDFAFADRAPYNMEFSVNPSGTAGSLQMWSGTEHVMDSSAVVTSISAATPAVLTTATTVSWLANEIVEFRFTTDTQARDAAILANRAFQLTVVSAGTQYSLKDPVGDAPFNGALITAIAAGEVTVHRVATFPTTYTASRIRTLRSVQSQGTAVLLHREVAPQRLDLLTEPTDASFATFSLNPAMLLDGPYLDPVGGSLITPDATTGIINLTLAFAAYVATQAYKKGDFVTSAGVGYRSLLDANVNHTPASTVGTWWAVASPGEAVGPSGFTTADIGRLVRLFTSASQWTWGRITGISTTGAIAQNLTGSVEIGSMTSNGGLAAAFDGITAQGLSASAREAGQMGYVGKNYTASTGGAKTISSAIVYPTNDYGFASIAASGATITVNLRGKATLPASRSDGTLLGTASFIDRLTPVTVTSNDVTTLWNYVWVEIIVSYGGAAIAEVQFFSASATAGTAVSIELLGPALPNTTQMTIWRLGVYGGANGFPSCGCYDKGRLWLAGAIPNRVDSSKSNDIFNFEPTNAAGVVADNNAIQAVFNSSKSNTVYWLKPGLQGIVCGTDGGEFIVRKAGDTGGISPTNIEAPRMTKYKCANIEPEETGLTTVFVQKHKRKVNEYLSDPYSGKFFAPNMSALAKHLAIDGIAELAYQEELTPILWALTGAGALVGCTYRRISMYSAEDPQFFAWHQHVHGAGRKFVSVCPAASENGGATDTLMVVTKDNNNNHYVELLTKLVREEDDLTSAQYLDAAVIPPSAVSYGSGTGLDIGGLWEHENQAVTAWVGGIDCGDFTVTNGVIRVPYSGLLTHAYIHNLTTAADGDTAFYEDRAVPIDGGALRIPIVIGRTYTSQGQLLPPVDQQKAGAANGPAFAKTQRSHRYGVKLYRSQGTYVGTRFTVGGTVGNLKPCLFRTKGGVAYTANQLYSGVHSDTLEDEYSYETQLAWEITRPYPTNVLALGPFLHTQDR